MTKWFLLWVVLLWSWGAGGLSSVHPLITCRLLQRIPKTSFGFHSELYRKGYITAEDSAFVRRANWKRLRFQATVVFGMEPLQVSLMSSLRDITLGVRGLVTTKIHQLHIFQVTKGTFVYISGGVQGLAEVLNVGPVFYLCMLVRSGFTVLALLPVWRRPDP